MAKKKPVAKKRAIAVPRDLDEASTFVARIGEYQREIAAINNDLAAKTQALKDKVKVQMAQLSGDVGELVEGLFAFAQARYEELTQGGKVKTVKLPSGSFSWRTTPPAVQLERGLDLAEFLDGLRHMGLAKFIRISESLDKEAMLANPEEAQTVPGVKIVQAEQFSVKPDSVDAEIVGNVDKLKKAL